MLNDNHTNNWTLGLKFVQFQKNYSYHRGIRYSPFAALFVSDAKVGLTSANLPQEILQKLESEDDLMAVLKLPSTTVSTLETLTTDMHPMKTISKVVSDATNKISDSINMHPTIDPFITEQNTDIVTVQPPAESPISPILELQNIIANKRKSVTEAQVCQAERMVKRSRIIMVAGEPGDNVTVPIPLVDSGRSDPRNRLDVIINRNENDMYTIAVRGGILKEKYSRNQFDYASTN